MQKEMMEENTQKILTPPPPMQNPIGKFHMGHHTLW